MKRKFWRIAIPVAILLLLIYFVGSNNGYTFSEKTAIRNSTPFTDGAVTYQHDYGSKKVAIWQSGDRYFAMLVHTQWGLIHRVSQTVELTSVGELLFDKQNSTLKRTWSASLNGKKYDLILAVQAVNPAIKKVIVSNDNIDNGFAEDVEDIKRNSDFYTELPLQDGVAASYHEMDMSGVGGFIFRGLDAEGKVVSLGR